MLHHLRLWRRFIIMAFVREAEYRAHFVLTLGQGALEVVFAVLGVLLIYQYTEQVAGWSRNDLLVLVGVYRLASSLIALQIAPNMTAISGYIRHGDMDFLLLRPVSSQFLVSTRRMNLPELANVVAGLALIVIAGQGNDWSSGGVLLALALLVCGLLALYALWLLSVTLCFWLVHVDTIDQLFYSAFAAARYPVGFFGAPVRLLFTFLIPIAFATTFPAEALLNRADLRLLPVGLLLTAVALGMSHWFWNFALRHYSSASS